MQDYDYSAFVQDLANSLDGLGLDIGTSHDRTEPVDRDHSNINDSGLVNSALDALQNGQDIWGLREQQDSSQVGHRYSLALAFGTLDDLGDQGQSMNSLSLAFGTLDDSGNVSDGLSGENSFALAFGSLSDLGIDFHLNKENAVVMESAHSTLTSQPSVTISNNGWVWRHDPDGSEHHVGYVSYGCFTNLNNDEVGYIRDGVFYAHHLSSEKSGWVEGSVIFDRHGNQIGSADTYLEGGAFMAFVVRGGQP